MLGYARVRRVKATLLLVAVAMLPLAPTGGAASAAPPVNDERPIGTGIAGNSLVAALRSPVAERRKAALAALAAVSSVSLAQAGIRSPGTPLPPPGPTSTLPGDAGMRTSRPGSIPSAAIAHLDAVCDLLADADTSVRKAAGLLATQWMFELDPRLPDAMMVPRYVLSATQTALLRAAAKPDLEASDRLTALFLLGLLQSRLPLADRQMESLLRLAVAATTSSGTGPGASDVRRGIIELAGVTRVSGDRVTPFLSDRDPQVVAAAALSACLRLDDDDIWSSVSKVAMSEATAPPDALLLLTCVAMRAEDGKKLLATAASSHRSELVRQELGKLMPIFSPGQPVAP